MTTIHNVDQVQNQAVHQIIHGDVNFFSGGTSSGKDQAYDLKELGSDDAPADDEILELLAFPEMFDRRRNVELPHQQTCQWIFGLDQYKGWSAGSSGLLWIKGKPGAGKSTLMAHLHQHISQQSSSNDAIFLEFFCNARGTELEHSPLGMLRSLLRQLFHRDPEVRHILRDWYTDECSRLTKDQRKSIRQTGWKFYRPQLERLFTQMVLKSAQRQQIVVFIDALDEVGEQAARETAHYLHTINEQVIQMSTKVKMCISCRHYPIPSNVPAIEVCVEHFNSGDIASYVQSHITIEDLRISHPEDSEGWQSLIQTIVEMANGIFQWVRLVMPMVEKGIGDGDSHEQIREWLLQVPKELEEVYRHILENIIDRKHRAESLRLFRWVCLAQDPLSLDGLRHALATSAIFTGFPEVDYRKRPRFVKTDTVLRLKVKSWSGGLVEVVGDKSLVQVIHQSVNDFLLTQGLGVLATLSEYQRGSLDTSQSEYDNAALMEHFHGDLYSCCVNLILTETTKRTNTFWVYHGNSLSCPRLVGRVSTFGEYALAHATTHAQKAGKHRSLDLEKEFQVLEKVLLTWQPWVSSGSRVSFQLNIKSTVLHFAAAAGLEDLVQYSIQNHADINVTNEALQTPLHVAITRGALVTAKMLVDAGSDLQAETKEGHSVLSMAVRAGNEDLCRWLIGRGARFNAHTGRRALNDLFMQRATLTRTPNTYTRTGASEHVYTYREGENLFRLIQSRFLPGRAGFTLHRHEESSTDKRDRLVRICIEGGADIDAPGFSDAGTRLYFASFFGMKHRASFLIGLGANVNLRSGDLGSPLQAASWGGLGEVVRLLIDKGADVNIQGGDYGNALQTASCYCHEDVILMLLDAGADVNATGGYYGSALQAASHYGSQRVVQRLIDAGADVNARGGVFGSALNAALRRGHDDVERILHNAGATLEEKPMQEIEITKRGSWCTVM